MKGIRLLILGSVLTLLGSLIPRLFPTGDVKLLSIAEFLGFPGIICIVVGLIWIVRENGGIKQLWSGLDVPNKLQSIGTILTILSLAAVWFQLGENTKTNKVSIRGQLYESEASSSSEEAEDTDQHLSSMWALCPPELTGQAFATTLVDILTDDPTALKAKNAAELYKAMFDLAVFTDPDRRMKTKDLRRTFLAMQTRFYHVHNAFDYLHDGILHPEEWRTWKGMIREMSAHPILLAIIWQGHENQYYSQDFGRFLQKELCSDKVPADVADIDDYKRDRAFIHHYYSFMTDERWPSSLPDY